MAHSEQKVVLPDGLDDPLQLCAMALMRAGFKDVRVNGGANLVTARKRSFGQWTKSQVILTLAPADAGGTLVTVLSNATAQSLSALATNPADRLVARAVGALQAMPGPSGR